MKLARMRTCGGGGTPETETAVERRFPVALLGAPAVVHTSAPLSKSAVVIERERPGREKEHRPPSSAPRSVRSLGDVRGEEGGGKAGSGREERHEERAGEKEEARQGAARSRWGAPSCRRASEFRPPSLWDSFASSLWGKNGCARYSNRREREGRTALGTPSASWCYSCSVARFESRVG